MAFFSNFLIPIKNVKGSVSVEFACYFMVFTLLCGFLVDMSFVFVRKSQLDRVNNSISSILRERNAFYHHRLSIDESDQVDALRLARVLLRDTGMEHKVSVSVRSITFFAEDSRAKKKVASDRTISDSDTDCISTDTEQSTLIDLAAWGQFDSKSMYQWQPVYEITLCVPGENSIFNRIRGLHDKQLAQLIVRNVVIPR